MKKNTHLSDKSKKALKELKKKIDEDYKYFKEQGVTIYCTIKWSPCPTCHGKAPRFKKYDAYYCKKCKLWTTPKCKDKNCIYCVARPLHPGPDKRPKTCDLCHKKVYAGTGIYFEKKLLHKHCYYLRKAHKKIWEKDNTKNKTEPIILEGKNGEIGALFG